MPHLLFENGPGKAIQFDGEIVVGRSAHADAVVDDASVSRRHAMLRWHEGECVVLDLGSANGTLVNGQRVVKPTRLKPGDMVAFGAIRARYATESAASSKSRRASRLDDSSTGTVMIAVPSSDNARESATAVANAEALRLRLELLEALGALSGRTFNSDALITLVLERVLALIPQAERAIAMNWDQAEEKLTLAAIRMRARSKASVRVSETLLREAIHRREAVVIVDAGTDHRFAKTESILAANIQSAMCAPMLFDDRVYGVLQVDAPRSMGKFSRNDLALLASVAGYLGMALGFARLHQKELQRELVERDYDLARRIQRRFLPEKVPEVRGSTFALEYAPALFVGGDFYDFIDLGGGRMAIAIGDVSGKGVSAALYAARLASELRHHTVGEREPSTILSKLNASLAAIDPEGMFVTLVLATLDAATHKLIVANAGHPLPLLRRAGGKVSELGRGGALPLGVMDTSEPDRFEHELAPGEAVLFFTDGASEALNAAGDLFGIPSLQKTFAHSRGTPQDTVRAIVEHVRAHEAGAPPSDDLTLICLQRS
jgi:serine phosphatase RsbU (regulator of sigma subunit)/pSer/pThr/pTyr-binding forkhead associated (FHA) protein